MNHNVKGSIIPRCIKFSKTLNLYERVIMEAFIDRENGLMSEDENFFTYQEWLADNLSISLRTVKKAIKSLDEKGYILITKTKFNGHSTNFYSINWKKIEEDDKDFEFSKKTTGKPEPIKEEPKEFSMEEPVNTLEEIPDDEWQILMNITHKTVVISDAYGGEEKERQLRTIGESCKVLSEYLQSHPEKTRKFSIYLKMIYEENSKKVA